MGTKLFVRPDLKTIVKSKYNMNVNCNFDSFTKMTKKFRISLFLHFVRL